MEREGGPPNRDSSQRRRLRTRRCGGQGTIRRHSLIRLGGAHRPWPGKEQGLPAILRVPEGFKWRIRNFPCDNGSVGRRPMSIETMEFDADQ